MKIEIHPLNLISFFTSKINKIHKNSSAKNMDGLKEKDNTKLKRDIISNKKFEPLYNEEELNGSFLIKDYDGVEEDPIIIDDTLLNDNSKNLKIEKKLQIKYF